MLFWFAVCHIMCMPPTTSLCSAVAGANRALTTDNRPINVDNLYGRLTAYPNVTASYVMEDHAPQNRGNILPIEVRKVGETVGTSAP
jgi:hypothetical protein